MKVVDDQARIDAFIKTLEPAFAATDLKFLVIVASGRNLLCCGRTGGDDKAMEMLAAALLDQEDKMQKRVGTA